MKKIILFLCLLISAPVLSQEAEGFAADSQGASLQDKPDYNKSVDKEVQGSDDFFDELIYPQYGSSQSNDFEGRQDQNPTESNYGYDGS
ncbi:MAG TPA: hypothetical protein PKI94_04595 [Candidatus Gastranaerophilaceae bacterium]|nr:hypothetical protein [Candidatus Gastranaerophilaceae bacterium]